MANLSGTWVVGKRLTTRCEFTVGGVLTDPTSVSCKVKSPAGVVTTNIPPTVVRESTGTYRLDFTLEAVGTWAIQWVSTGDVEALDETLVVAEPSVI